MKEQVNLALARRGFDSIGAAKEVTGARLEAEPIEHRLAKRSFDLLA